MRDLDELIASIASQIDDLDVCEKASQATLSNYEDLGMGDMGRPLKMIAWDRS